jgi:HPt (histidine-containing phosphotransfer) domain-containing protein
MEESAPVQAPAAAFHPLAIEGVDMQKGIDLTGGSEEGYKQVLSAFCLDLEDRLEIFKAAPTAETMRLFTTHAHAIKSAAGVIGAADISAEAAQLEAAGKADKVTAIEEKRPAFYEKLAALRENIRIALEIS